MLRRRTNVAWVIDFRCRLVADYSTESSCAATYLDGEIRPSKWIRWGRLMGLVVRD